MKIYAVLFLFFGLYLSICIWVFLIITDSLRKISLNGFFRIRRNFVKAVDRQFTMLVENEYVTEAEIVILCNKMESKKMKRYFLQRFVYFADRVRNKNKIKEYFKTAFPYLKDMLELEKNLHYSENSFRLMLLGEFRQDDCKVNDTILEALDDDSFDIRTNALRALSLIGNSDYFNRGLIKACSGVRFFNSRHISEMIGSFEGDKEELRQQMLECFYRCPDTYRYQVLVFLAANPSSTSMDFVLKYLRAHPENKENVIACLRFLFASDIHKPAKELIYEILKEEDVEIRAISVKLAPKYFYDEWKIIKLLFGEGYLKSGDWHVRRNSAAALTRIGLDKEEIILLLLSMKDQYARDAVTYAMFEAGMTTYDELNDLGGAGNAIA